MSLLRIEEATPLAGLRLRLKLTDGSVLEREVSDLLTGPVFDPLKADPSLFEQVTVEGGTVVWPNGADLCPDVLIWGGSPPGEAAAAPAQLASQREAP